MSYSNYSTYLKYKNCCRPIGDTGPPGPAGPTGPAATIDISGSKGEILYFSETDNLVSTDNVFIQEGNVTIDNNVVITRNLSMSDQFINDVSGIYFSDETYIGHGSSFDITTSETLDISAAGGISVTGNLSINDATTVNKTLDVIGNTTLENLFVNGSINNLIEISGDTIQPIINESANLGNADKNFDFGFFYQINSKIARITDTLAMKNGSIINVHNISSSSLSNLAINGSYAVAINGSYGVTITGDLTIDDSATFCDILDVSGATTIRSNLSMNNNFINDVSGIYFSDETYIGHGSSFDITTSERLDISAAGGVTLNGNLTVNDAATINNTLIVDGATTITGNLNFKTAGNISPSSASTIAINTAYLNIDADTTIDRTLTVDAATTIRSTLDVSGNLSMNDNFINDVSGIYFSDETYIGHGSSFDITTSERLDISAAGGVTLNGNLTVNDAATINNTLIVDGATTITGNLNFKTAGNISPSSASTIAINTAYLNIDADTTIDRTLTVDAATTIRSTLDVSGNLSMNDNFINDVSGIYFTKGNLLFSDFSSATQQVQLPSSQGQPISLERKTLFYNPNFNLNIPTGNTIIDFSGSTIFNQLKLNVNGNIIGPSPDISGQYIEIYANFDVSSNSSPSKTFSLDISSVSGASFLETIDVRSISKQGKFYLTYGPHIFIPSQWENTTGFNFLINNTGSNNFNINSYKLMFKSYFM